jgi:hypothetical protein
MIERTLEVFEDEVFRKMFQPESDQVREFRALLGLVIYRDQIS